MPLLKGAVETQRLFFALCPEPALQEHLAHTAATVLPSAAGRRVRAENLHCTLVFLGAVDAAQRLCLEDAASRIQAEAFTLTLDRLGYFRRPQVAWFGCSTTPAALQGLVAGLSDAAARCGFPPERRLYDEVHLTVARKLRQDPGRLPIMPITWSVKQFVLMESISEADGVHYRPLCSWQL
jgi:RNA 2',3'-cyclic 3'-phosphodiesterase